MTISGRALTFGGMGLLAALWMVLSLLSGEVRSRGGGVTYRDKDPFQFYVWIFFYALLTTLFIGAGVFFLLHPHFSLAPPPQVSDD